MPIVLWHIKYILCLHCNQINNQTNGYKNGCHDKTVTTSIQYGGKGSDSHSCIQIKTDKIKQV